MLYRCSFSTKDDTTVGADGELWARARCHSLGREEGSRDDLPTVPVWAAVSKFGAEGPNEILRLIALSTLSIKS